MPRLARLAGPALLLAFAALPPAARGLPHPSSCDDVTCSGHGTCMLEGDRPFCFCEDGYAAEALACEQVGVPARVWAARRSHAAADRAVRIATRYRDLDSFGVGADLRAPPYGLRHYLGHGEQWCTDFVAWVYEAAGVPLTGGQRGGWLVANNFAMREWFRRHDLWVERGSDGWRSFEPRPGDYIRFHTRSGIGHSGIVRYADGGTLYTVEGNVGNRVRLRRFPDYRGDARIDGVGMLVLPGYR